MRKTIENKQKKNFTVGKKKDQQEKTNVTVAC